MDFRQLRQFVILAEELHFGRAAKRLGIAQPPLSQSIKRLETDLGFDLFDRSSRSVELSAAGRAFLPEVRSALSQLATGAEQAQRVARGEIAELDVGFTSSALFNALPSLIQRTRAALPSVQFKLLEHSSADQIEALRAGRLDLALVHRAPRLLDGLETLVVERSRHFIAIPEAWPLARNASVRLVDLADCPFIMPPHRDGLRSLGPLLAACETAGFTPKVAQEALQSFTMLSLCAAGFGVAFVPESASLTAMHGVRFLPIEGLPAGVVSEIIAAWLPGARSPALQAVLDSLGRQALAPGEIVAEKAQHGKKRGLTPASS